MLHDRRYLMLLGLPIRRDFGAFTDSFLYRWTGSCIANPEYELENMLKAIPHALASSESPNTPFLVVSIYRVCENSPRNSAAIRCQHNMSTLIRIPEVTRGLFPHINNPTRPHLSSPLQNGWWNLPLSPTTRVGRHLSPTNGSTRSQARQSKPHASSRRRKP